MMKRPDLWISALLTIVFIAALQTGTVSATAAPSERETAPPLTRSSVLIDGESEEIETNLPWKLVKDDHGETHLYVGPAVPRIDYPGSIIASWDGPDGLEGIMQTQGLSTSWACELLSQSPILVGAVMEGWIGIACDTPNMPSYRFHWQFDYTNKLGIRIRYSPKHQTGWVSQQNFGMNVHSYCNTADGRSYGYHTKHRGEATGGYFWSWERLPQSVQLPCGTSEL